MDGLHFYIICNSNSVISGQQEIDGYMAILHPIQHYFRHIRTIGYNRSMGTWQFYILYNIISDISVQLDTRDPWMRGNFTSFATLFHMYQDDWIQETHGCMAILHPLQHYCTCIRTIGYKRSMDAWQFYILYNIISDISGQLDTDRCLAILCHFQQYFSHREYG